MSGRPTKRTVLFSLLVTLVALVGLAALPAAIAAGTSPDGTSNTLFFAEKSLRCDRVQPDPQTLRSGGPGSLRIWVTAGFFEVDPVASGRRLAEVRLVSKGPSGRKEVRLFGVTFKPASNDLASAAGAPSPAPRQGPRGVGGQLQPDSRQRSCALGSRRSQIRSTASSSSRSTTAGR